MEELTVNATKLQIEEFKNSVLWQDICRELDFWASACKEEPLDIVANAETNNPSTAAVLMHLGDISGRVKSVQYFKEILDVFLSIKIQEENNDES